MNRKSEIEYRNLLKLGIPEEVASIIVYGKDGNEHLLDEIKDTNKDLSEEVKKFIPFNETLNNNIYTNNNDKDKNEII